MPHFDKEQQKIIDIQSGTHLVLAPPGCGKTAILSERVRRALESGIQPDDMICLTFTNRAARGMEERVMAEGINTGDELFIGNTHRFCGQFLFDNNLVEKSTEIIDELNVESILEEICEDVVLGDDAKSRGSVYNAVYDLQHLLFQFREKMPDKSIIYGDRIKNYSLRGLCEDAGLSPAKSTILNIYRDPDAFIRDEIANSPSHFNTVALLKLAKRYEDYKIEHHLIDFDDILLNVYAHFLSNPEHKHYSWIQIDEVQDLNPLQIAIIDELARPDGTTIYLGDEQQAIFSFMGAKISTLHRIKEKCNGRIHHLENNYRSPSYIIDMLNEFAVKNLNADNEILPKATKIIEPAEDWLSILYSRDSITLSRQISRIVNSYPKDERTAIIVASNSEADQISTSLTGIPHFKISGKDYFCRPETSALLSLVSLINNECSQIAWANLLVGIRITDNLKKARKAVHSLFNAGISPADLLRYDCESSLGRFKTAFTSEERPVVIFDTETSGLDTHNDDIIQLAAIKTSGGEIIDRFNVFLETDKEIPPMLGEIENPLVKEYASQPHTSRKDGLMSFIEFAKGCTLCGHNLYYDYSILRHNLKRDCGLDRIESVLDGELFDTLHLTRLLSPNLHSFKLKDILFQFNLEGENSHLADDDIIATYSLSKYIAEAASDSDFIEKQQRMFEITKVFRQKLIEKIGDTFKTAFEMRDTFFSTAPLAKFVRMSADLLIKNAKINLDEKKTSYFIKYLISTSPESPAGLREELEKRATDIQTLREADLCDSNIIEEKVFVTTLHKAKGLEFENVIVFNVTDGTFPFFYSETQEEKNEDARKLYVALSRSKKRLLITIPETKIVHAKNGKVYRFSTELSPFIRNIREHFSVRNLDSDALSAAMN